MLNAKSCEGTAAKARLRAAMNIELSAVIGFLGVPQGIGAPRFVTAAAAVTRLVEAMHAEEAHVRVVATGDGLPVEGWALGPT